MARPQLINQLDRQLHKRLILLSTPPGYGKTTLLAEFARANKLPTAWCQLDAADGDPIIFLNSIIESLRHVHDYGDGATVPPGRAASALLREVDTATPKRILTVLINELVECIDRSWLVILEDYHEIANPAVHALVDMLLENAPPGLTLLISTRSDPPLALTRLRARGLLAELRSGDLRFTEEEALQWLHTRLPSISAEDALILSEKAEGWATGLQLVFSSLSGSNPADITQLVATLSGTHHYIFEFLVSEVFQRQPPVIQMFLLHTAVFSQMTADLCDALPGISGAQTMLDHLVRQNLFITGLDEQQEWFRYHPLFQEFLLDKLHRDQPDLYRSLQHKAGQSYEREREYEAALTSYLRAEALAEAARVLALLAPNYIELGRVVVLQRHFKQLPEDCFAKYPKLLLYHGDVLRKLGQPTAAVVRYEQALRAFEKSTDLVFKAHTLVRLGELARVQGLDFGHFVIIVK